MYAIGLPSPYLIYRPAAPLGCHMLCSSRMVRGLARPLFYVLGVATAVAAYESALQASRSAAGRRPEPLPWALDT